MTKQSKRNIVFGEYLKEGIASIARRQRVQIRAVEYNVAEELGVRPSAVEYWKKGNVPKYTNYVLTLIRYCVKNGRVGRDWAESMLRHSTYQFQNVETLLDDLFGQMKEKSNPILQYRPDRHDGFLGRKLEFDAIWEALRSEWKVVLIEGLPGAGKTSLAIEVIYACLGQPCKEAKHVPWPKFSTLIMVSAENGQFSLDQLLDLILYRLGHRTAHSIPEAQKQQTVLDSLAQQPVLLVIDGFESVTDEKIASFLIWTPKTVKVLLTSRQGERILSKDFERYPPARIHLDGLPLKDAIAFLRVETKKNIGLLTSDQGAVERERLQTLLQVPDETLFQLVHVTGGNPKAIQLALGQIRTTDMPIPNMIEALYSASDTLYSLFDYFFRDAWKGDKRNQTRLEAIQEVWMATSFFSGHMTAEALATSAGLTGKHFQMALDYLIGWSLLERVPSFDGKIRYRTHPLMKAFALSQIRETSNFESVARIRWAQWYLDFTQQQDVEDWTSFSIIEEENDNILAVIEWGLSNNHEVTYKLIKAFWYSLYIRGHWRICEEFTKKAIEHAISHSDMETVLWLKSHLGWILAEQDKKDEALDLLLKTEEEILQSGNLDLLAETDVLNYTGQVYLRCKEFEKAEAYEQRFISMTERLEDHRGTTAAKYYLARIRMAREQYEIAEKEFREMIELAQKIYWKRAEAYGYYRLALALMEQDKEGSENYLSLANQSAEEFKDLQLIASASLAQAELALKHYNSGQKNLKLLQEATESCEKALDLFTRLDVKDEIKNCQNLLETIQCQGNSTSFEG